MSERKMIVKDMTDGNEIRGLFVGTHLNYCSHEHKNFINAMAQENSNVQYNFTLLCIEWLLDLSKVNYYDDRNKASYEIACQMAMSHKFDGYPHRKMHRDKVEPSKEVFFTDGADVEKAVKVFVTNAYADENMEQHKAFLRSMLNEHKTIQQNFARFCFNWFNYVADSNPTSGSAHVKLAKRALQYRKPLPFI